MRPVDILLAAYVAMVSALIVVRGPLLDGTSLSLLAFHLLLGAMWWWFSKRERATSFGRGWHALYPLLLLLPLYGEIGIINAPLGKETILLHDAAIQRWEAAWFGRQISYEWIRTYPSVFWSGLLHLAYLWYYPIVFVAPFVLVLRRQSDRARAIVLPTMAAFIICYLWFLFYPVAGPYYAFDHPTGPVRDVWSAKLVYGMLGNGGSSIGAAFPSSHVAATTAATIATYRVWKPFGRWLVLPAILLVFATVYCQMHYGVDALAGMVAGVAAVAAVWKLRA